MNYEKLSRTLPAHEWKEFLLSIREQRELREAFPHKQNKERISDYLEQRDEELGYGG